MKPFTSPAPKDSLPLTEPEKLIADAVLRAHLRSAPVSTPDADGAARGAGISRIIDAQGICTLTFDRRGSAANVLDRDTLLELDAHLDFIGGSPNVRGLLLTSAKPNIFVAGADVHALAGMADRPASAPAPELEELLGLGQRVFNRLAGLNVPVVAAIHGACLGGGCELALACGHRIASDDGATRIGLPETQLGILPAWGGCTRLPRLVGLSAALKMILGGKPVRARDALSAGLVDELVPREHLLGVARERLLRGLPARSGAGALDLIKAPVVRTLTARELADKSRGNYPALFEALEVITRGIGKSVTESLEMEQAAFLRLVRTPACRNLLRLFVLKERARKSVLAPTSIAPPVSRCAVIGAGVMGAGIAQALSARGLSVVLREVNLEQLAEGMAGIAELYHQAERRGLMTAHEARAGLDRVFPAATDVPLRGVDLVIEAVSERIALKKDVFRCLAAQTRPDTILATNTSALSVAEIAAATNCPARVVGLHFFNPVHRMELVEVVAPPTASPETVARAVSFARQIGKVPVVVRDSPGFIVNRVLMPYLVEAAQLCEAGAPIRDIDNAMLDFGMPMGPLRLLDEIGLDVALHVAGTLAQHFPDRVALPDLVRELVQNEELGRKSGRGFYVHEGGEARVPMLHAPHKSGHFSADELQQRMVLLMVNEAARCVEEGVACAADVDLAMVLGTGFAPFRGGPLSYADGVGCKAVAAALHHLAAGDARFRPCDLIGSLAAKGGTFHGKEEQHEDKHA
jgi:3-hydroxyacyl-CoA dehydrogenase/enoyl-CoA hydratase/3-hydroxybutyryl-CoA epimerase